MITGSDHCAPLLDIGSALQKPRECWLLGYPFAKQYLNCPTFITTFGSSNEKKKRLFHVSLFCRKNWGLAPGSGQLSMLLSLVGRAQRGSLSHSCMSSNFHSDSQPTKKECGPPRRWGHADTFQYLNPLTAPLPTPRTAF